MAWYTTHQLRYRGRLVDVSSRYGCYNGASVVKGKPLNLSESSRDGLRLEKLFNRNERIRCEIQRFEEEMARHESQYC